MAKFIAILLLFFTASASFAQGEIHPSHAALIAAYQSETSAARRAILAANIERWRLIDGDFSGRYLVVNAAAFELTLWDGRTPVRRWPVIVGRTRTPTPEFTATVSGIVFNPWWEIPSSIAREGIASMVSNRPREAARRGYVYQDGRYRQRPGAGNALGRMKLVMPNPFSVFLHDTSNPSLFANEDRALSHGCVRVSDALEFAATLLAVQPGWDRARVDALVESGATETVALDQPIPVYISYFTAEPDSDGTIRFYPDIYRRDLARAPTPDRLAAVHFDRDDPSCRYADHASEG